MTSQTTITIEGKQIGLRFGMLSAQLFAEQIEKGKKLFVGDSINDLGIAYVLYSGYLNHCEVKEADPELKFEAFYDFIEDTENAKEVTGALDVWMHSRTIKAAIEVSEGSKKKNSKQKTSGK